MYGRNCGASCGNCGNGKSSCDIVSGTCPNSVCQQWWTGDKCDVAISIHLYTFKLLRLSCNKYLYIVN